jgi:predicted glycosyltransferase
VRVWIDISNSPQVLVFRPLIRLLEERGHTVEVTTRAYAQTLELLTLHGMRHDVVGPGHGGGRALGKARVMASRLRLLRSWAGGRDFDLALSHASHELPLVARSLGIPASYAYDYEFARAQHTLGSRAARRVVVPEAIPQERLDRLGAHVGKVRRYPGLKEEYYLAGFEPDGSVLDRLGLDRERVLVVVRTAPEVSLYHRHGNVLFGDLLHRIGSDPEVQAVVFPRTADQREAIRSLVLPSLVVPDEVVDAQSLVALSDLVVSAGGTMNREAVALGIPVYTEFAGRLGGVDEQLIRERRLRILTDPHAIELTRRTTGSPARTRRDPRELLGILLPAGGYP